MSAGAVLIAVPVWVWAIHCLAGLVILAEALNKLERMRPPLVPPAVRAALRPREVCVAWLKRAAWFLLALGGAGVLASPFFNPTPPSLEHVCIAVGFAVLILRTRVKEG